MADTSKQQSSGESGGGAYPNPHKDKQPSQGGYGGHGGQTEIGYHGPGQLGDEEADAEENSNSATKD